MDANVLIAALMRDSTTRRLLVLGGHELHVPAYVFEEIENHWGDLSSRSGLPSDTLREVLGALRSPVAEHRVSAYGDLLDAATRRLEGGDVKDAPYVALVLALSAEGLWTEDRGLTSVEGVRVIRTADLVWAVP